MQYSKIFLLIICFGLSAFSHAENLTAQMLPSSRQAEYEQLIKETRCMTCPNQSIAESNAPVAIALRERIYEKVKSGQSSMSIRAELISEYGQGISYRPSVSFSNIVLWLFPLFLVLSIVVYVRKNYDFH